MRSGRLREGHDGHRMKTAWAEDGLLLRSNPSADPGAKTEAAAKMS